MNHNESSQIQDYSRKRIRSNQDSATGSNEQTGSINQPKKRNIGNTENKYFIKLDAVKKLIPDIQMVIYFLARAA